MSSSRPTVVVAGLGDTGVLIATRLARSCRVVAITTRPALVSGQELGTRLTDPTRWRRTYLVPLARFRRLDAVEVLHGRVVGADLDHATVDVETADGGIRLVPYDYLVVATGVANGFWRHDRVEDQATIDAALDAVHRQLTGAGTVAVIGGGATGVSVADNLARRGDAEVHLFFSGEEPLPDFHPDVRPWIMQRLTDDGVVLHPNHRAVIPDGFQGERLTTEPVEWTTGQPPFTADVVMWAVGVHRPFTDFLPAAVLDDAGFVRVDANLRVPGYDNVFAVGDVAASDPLRSSARNWGFRVVVGNVRALAHGRARRLHKYKAAPYRWGSLLGIQPEGLLVVQPNGKRVTFPRWIAEPLLLGTFVHRILYGGLRRASRGR